MRGMNVRHFRLFVEGYGECNKGVQAECVVQPMPGLCGGPVHLPPMARCFVLYENRAHREKHSSPENIWETLLITSTNSKQQ